MNRRPGHRGAVVAAAGAVVCGALGVLGTAGAVAADWDRVPETGTPGRLVLDAAPYPMRIPDLSPGDPAAWQIHTHVENDDSVTLDLELRKDGDLVTHPDGLHVRVTSCDHEWRDVDSTPSCDDPAPVMAAGPADRLTTGSTTYPVRDPDRDGETYLLVELSVADTAAAAADESLMGLTATVGIGVTAAAVESVEPTPPASASASATPSSAVPVPPHVAPPSGSLAYTGGAFAGPILLAGALVLAGIAARLHRRAQS